MCDVRAVWMWMRTWMLSLLTSSVSEPRRAEIVTISSAVWLVSRSVYPLLRPVLPAAVSTLLVIMLIKLVLDAVLVLDDDGK